MRAKGLAALIALTAVWGTTFPTIKVVVGRVGFAYYVALRFGLATLILLPLALTRKEQLRRNTRWGALLGALYFGGITLQGWGMEYTTASNAAFVTGLSVVIVFALEVALGREKPSARLAGAIALALAGLYLMSLSGGAYRAMLGDLIVLAGSFFWALQIIAVDRAARGDLYSLLFLESLVTALCASLVAPVTGRPTLAEISAALPPLAYLATVCTIGANALQIYGQRYVPSIEAALIYLLEPVFAAVFSYAALGEGMGPAQAVGAALILASMAVSSLRAPRERPLS